MKEVSGKVAFITGGGSGIGLGMAKVFTAAGMKVVIADVRQDHLDAAKSVLKSAGPNVHAIAVDVTDREAMERAAREALRVFGKIHVLCNNAGVSLFGPMDQATYEDWDEAVLSRPKNLQHSGYPVTDLEIKRLDGVLSVGMDPVQVAERVLRGIRHNEALIFPHAEFRQELQDIFAEIIAALPNEIPDAGRMAMENGRRARKKHALQDSVGK